MNFEKYICEFWEKCEFYVTAVKHWYTTLITNILASKFKYAKSRNKETLKGILALFSNEVTFPVRGTDFSLASSEKNMVMSTR